jgi:hypothetical protein
MCEHETPPTNLVISISMFWYTYIWSTSKPSNIPLSKEKIVFMVSLVIGAIIAIKFFIKHM